MKTIIKVPVLLSSTLFFVVVQAAQPERASDYPEGTYLRKLPRELQEELKKFQAALQATDTKALEAAMKAARTGLTNAGAGPYNLAVAQRLRQEAQNVDNALQAYNKALGTKDKTLQDNAQRLIGDLTWASRNTIVNPLP